MALPSSRLCLKCHKPIPKELLKKDRRICDSCFGKVSPEDELWDSPVGECSFSLELMDMLLDKNPIHRLLYG